MKIFYEFRWFMYHYNSGRADNGVFLHKKRYATLAEAQCLKNKIEIFLKEDKSSHSEAYHDFISIECWDGFIERIDGIYEITEKKL